MRAGKTDFDTWFERRFKKLKNNPADARAVYDIVCSSIIGMRLAIEQADAGCDYCRTGGSELVPDSYLDEVYFHMEDKPSWGIAVTSDREEFLDMSGGIRIFYCPMCGRKLGEVDR